jgi:hypothetical protein
MTRASIPARVFLALGLSDEADTPSTAETADILALYDGVYDQLAVENLVSWGPLEDLPKWAELPVVGIVAEFYRPAKQRGETQLPVVEVHKASMRRLLAGPYVPVATQPEYF